MRPPRPPLLGLIALLAAIWGAGMFMRGFWTPDEPREADIAWRMSWQTDKAVPLLAGEAFCEKPPFTYWAAAVPIKVFGLQAWAARLPNLLYAFITALSVGLLATRSAGRVAGMAATAAMATLLLSYQVAIWLATDAPLLAAVSLALLGLHMGFYASTPRQRLLGYTLMHASLALGFLCKSAAAWMTPALTLGVLIVWEKRFRELLRIELYAGLLVQAAIIGAWVYCVYRGLEGTEHLKVFFWNNLAGRFVHVDAPAALQYAQAHRNSPGKYFLEMPVYLFPWTLLVAAAVWRAWRARGDAAADPHSVRFAAAVVVPTLVVLSCAATARNIYFATALPGVALLLGWWAQKSLARHERGDRLALRATAVLLIVCALASCAALMLLAYEEWTQIGGHVAFVALSAAGIVAAVFMALRAWRLTPLHAVSAQSALLFAYAALLVGPAPQIYGPVNDWQNLAQIGRGVQRDSGDRPLVLLAPDETTRALVDLYGRTDAEVLAGPLDVAAIARIEAVAQRLPGAMFLLMLPGREAPRRLHLTDRHAAEMQASLDWVHAAHLRLATRYGLPNGRRYALLESEP
jgi:4-amino-4-deoxy-L-arabinose transferase-like glycosyltransferase